MISDELWKQDTTLEKEGQDAVIGHRTETGSQDLADTPSTAQVRRHRHMQLFWHLALPRLFRPGPTNRRTAWRVVLHPATSGPALYVATAGECQWVSGRVATRSVRRRLCVSVLCYVTFDCKRGLKLQHLWATEPCVCVRECVWMCSANTVPELLFCKCSLAW
jgi:hypothetical protein